MAGISSLPPPLVSSTVATEQQSAGNLLLETHHIPTRSYSIKRRAETWWQNPQNVINAAASSSYDTQWFSTQAQESLLAVGWSRPLYAEVFTLGLYKPYLFSHMMETPAHVGHCCSKVHMSWRLNVTLAIRFLRCTKWGTGKSSCLHSSFINFKWILGKSPWHNSVQEGGSN